MASGEGRTWAVVVVVAKFREGDGLAVKIDTFGEGVTKIVRGELVKVEDAFLLQISLMPQ